MKAIQCLPQKITLLFLLVLLFTGMSAYSQTEARPDDANIQASLRDSIAFNSYFARRGAITAMRDSAAEAQGALNASDIKPQPAYASDPVSGNVLKLNTAALDLPQPIDPAVSESVILLPLNKEKEKNSAGNKR